ncbi:hypothetical protein H4V95_003218 [Arthrobacter sp. CAN_C5]|nr:hypothetical protein [Arthrobacter sp. CAN_C5]
MGKHHAQEALDLLSSAMDPFIEERMRPFTGGLEWTVVLQELDRMRGVRARGRTLAPTHPCSCAC